MLFKCLDILMIGFILIDLNCLMKDLESKTHYLSVTSFSVPFVTFSSVQSSS